MNLKMMVAAFLYNITGEKAYEDAVNKECGLTPTNSRVAGTNGNLQLNQIWAFAGYLIT